MNRLFACTTKGVLFGGISSRDSVIGRRWLMSREGLKSPSDGGNHLSLSTSFLLVLPTGLHRLTIEVETLLSHAANSSPVGVVWAQKSYQNHKALKL